MREKHQNMGQFSFMLVVEIKWFEITCMVPSYMSFVKSIIIVAADEEKNNTPFTKYCLPLLVSDRCHFSVDESSCTSSKVEAWCSCCQCQVQRCLPHLQVMNSFNIWFQQLGPGSWRMCENWRHSTCFPAQTHKSSKLIQNCITMQFLRKPMLKQSICVVM